MENCIQRIRCGELKVIGIRDYINCDRPLSDLYINGIAGLGLKNVAAIAPGEYESGANLLIEKGILAVNYVLNDFKRAIEPSFRFNSIIDSANACEFSKGASFFWPVEPQPRGLKISRVEAPLAKIRIKRLFIRSMTAGDVVLKIEDKNEVHHFPVTLINGTTIVNLDKKFNDDELFVTIDNTAFQMAQGFCFDTCNGCGGGPTKNIVMEGWNGTSVDNYLYGINAEVILECDEEELFCLALDKLYWSIYHKHAEFVFDEMATTNRLNNIATCNKELAAAKVLEYEQKYKDEFKQAGKSLSSFLKSFRGDCITCKGNKYVTELP